MGLLDKVKGAAQNVGNTIGNAKNSAMEKIAEKKETYDTKKRLEAEHREAMEQKVKDYVDNITNQVAANYSEDKDGFYSGVSKEEIFRFTKDFFKKIVLPANANDESCVSFYPYISEKQCKKLSKMFQMDILCENCLAIIYDNDGDVFVLAYDKLYYKVVMKDDAKYIAIGTVDIDKVSKIYIASETEESHKLMCDDVMISTFEAGTESDYITLDMFFDRIMKRNFTITDEDVHNNIVEKIGDQTFFKIKDELEEGELIKFFAYACGEGYICCTTDKIFIQEIHSGGNVSNFNKYYYDEITRIEAVQEQSDLADDAVGVGIGDFLMDYAVSSAMDAVVDSFTKNVCDFIIQGDGIYENYSGMVKVEADRIVEIYDEYKRSNRKAKRTETVAAEPVQQDILGQIQKLASLKDAGILSEEEFETKKKELLAKL